MAANVKENDEREKNVLAWKNKMEKTKKGEILRELRKLHVQIVALEREKSTHLYSKRSDFRQEFSTLEEMDSKLTTDLKTEHVKVKQQLEKISHMVKRFHKELKDVKPTPEFVEKLKVIMEEIEGTINNFKEQQRHQYDELMRTERITTQEIQAMERKFDAWSQISNSALNKKQTPSVPLASARDITKDLPPQVAAFEKFLEETGGVRGGWDEYDHGTFLKFRNRYKGKSIFLQHALVAIPTKTEEEIQEHEDWYQNYLSLNEKKKESIKKWRERKEEEKEELLTKADSELTAEEKEDERKLRLKEQIEIEKRERFGQLNAWKVQKELERAQAEEKKLREALEKKRKEEDSQKRKAELKQKVDEYKKQKEEEEEFLEEQKKMWEMEEKERQRLNSAREIHRFRDRDQKKLQEKLAKEKEKENEKIEKQKRLERLRDQVDVEVEREPSRLLQPTAGWKSRLKEKGPSGSGPVIHMPHRAVPSWRQGMM